jgi:hypothetical protein
VGDGTLARCLLIRHFAMKKPKKRTVVIICIVGFIIASYIDERLGKVSIPRAIWRDMELRAFYNWADEDDRDSTHL